jgi:hypothetical protein
MKIARRKFLFTIGALAASPVFPNLLSSTRRVPIESPLPAVVPDQPELVFKIYGWSVPGDVASNCHEVWLHVNKSWRTAWR